MILIGLLLDLSECIILEFAWLINVKFLQIVDNHWIHTKISPALFALQILHYVLLIFQLEHAPLHVGALLLMLALQVVLTLLHFNILLFTVLTLLNLHSQ